MIFYGRVVVVDDIGNITYGYLGRAAGFSTTALKAGSMGYHVYNHAFKYMDNEWEDERNIQLGANWYDGANIQVRFDAQ